MAEVVKSIPDDTRRFQNKKYPWNEWMDGQIWKLKKGVDFSSVSSLRNNVRSAAATRGGFGRVRMRGEFAFIQFVKVAEEK